MRSRTWTKIELWIFTRPPTWTGLRSLGENRFLRTSFIWLFLVPILARILEGVPQDIEVSLLGATARLHFGLPFNWTLLFFAALFAALGEAIYIWKCPSIIRTYTSFSQFEEQGRGSRDLSDYYIEHTMLEYGFKALSRRKVLKWLKIDDKPILARENSPLEPEASDVARRMSKTCRNAGRYVLEYSGNAHTSAQLLMDAPNAAEVIYRLAKVNYRLDRLAQMFWDVRRSAEKSGASKRLLCWIFYCVSGSLLTVIVCINIFYVFKHIGT